MGQRLANLEGLLQLSRKEGVDIRPSLLRVLTDLYVQEPSHTREEAQQFVELALRLLPAVDTQTRTAVAHKLAAYPATPTPLVDLLFREARTASAGAQDPVPAPADSTQIARERVAVNEPLVRNDAPGPFSPTRPRSLGERFLLTDSDERLQLLLELEELQDQPTPALPRPSPETARRLEAAALARKPAAFARELQASMQLSARTAWRIVQDETGEPLLVIARMLDLRNQVVLRILLLLNRSIGESVDRVFSLMWLYPEITEKSAAVILASWLKDAERPAARFQPWLAPDRDTSAGVREQGRPTRSSPADRSATRPAATEPRERHGTT